MQDQNKQKQNIAETSQNDMDFTSDVVHALGSQLLKTLNERQTWDEYIEEVYNQWLKAKCQEILSRDPKDLKDLTKEETADAIETLVMGKRRFPELFADVESEE